MQVNSPSVRAYWLSTNSQVTKNGAYVYSMQLLNAWHNAVTQGIIYHQRPVLYLINL